MKNQPDTSLRIRLASIAIIGLFIALGAVAYFSGQQVKRDSDLVAKDAVPGTIAAHQMRMDMSRSIGWVMVAASAQTTESRDASLKTVHEADVDFASHVAQYKATIIINPAKDQSLLDEVTSQYAKFQQQRMAYEALILAGDRDKSAAFLENDLVPAYVSAINSAQELLDYNHANSLTYAEHISNSVHRLYWAVAVVMLLALVSATVLIVNLSIRRRELRELRESEELFRTSFENATVGVCLVATDGRFLKVNRNLCAMLGYSEDELLQLTFNDVTQDEDKEIGRKFLDDVLSGGPKTMRTEKRYLHKDGQVVWAYLSTALIEQSRGKDAYMISYIQDITERKRATEQLEMLKASIDKHFDGAYWLDTNNRFVYVNDSACKALGYTREEMLGQPITLIAPHIAPQLLQEIWKGLRETGFFTRESEHRRKDGSKFPVEIVSTYVRFEGKEFNCGFARDITERKRAETALVALQSHQERTLSALGEGLQVIDRNGIIIYENPAAAAMLGWNRHELIGRFGHDLIHHTRADGVPYPQAECKILATLLDGVARRVDDEVFWRKDGTSFPVAYICTAMRDEAGEIKEVVVAFRDITERKRAEVALREKQAQLMQAMDIAKLAHWEFDVATNLFSGDENIFQMLGTTPAREGGFSMSPENYIRKFVHPQDAGLVASELALALATTDPNFYRQFEQRIIRADGIERVMLTRSRIVLDAANRAVKIQGANQDITEQKQAQAELISKTALLEAQVDSTIDGILVVDGLGRRILQNQRFLELFQVPEEIARDGDHAELLLHVTNRMKKPQHFTERVAHLYAHPDEIGRDELELVDGGVIDRYTAPVRDKAGKHYGRIWTFRDITAQRKVEEQFRQAQKMEAIGTLAGGIAHDFNNILAAINGYTEMAKRRVANDPVVIRYLDAVFQGGNRAVSLVKQILSFSRPQETQERKPVELGNVVAEPLKLLRASIPSNIEFDISLDSNLPPVLADATQVHQIVMNLCTNASHAMKDRVGRLGVRLEKFTVDKLLAGANVGLRAGPYVRLSVSDTGHGMSRATIARIFEPFFTTKGPGEGTGLGLSVVHGIMQSHGGAITVYSQPGEGTVFHLYFPITAEESKAAAAVLEEAPAGHGERILFVDDEMPLALLGQTMLVELGYVVENKTNVAEALEVVRANPTAFDVVITDLTMPLMLGTEFAQQLLLIRPNLPIILTTGYSASLTPERVREMGIREILAKPHTIQSLGMAVHRALKD